MLDPQDRAVAARNALDLLSLTAERDKVIKEALLLLAKGDLTGDRAIAAWVKISYLNTWSEKLITELDNARNAARG